MYLGQVFQLKTTFNLTGRKSIDIRQHIHARPPCIFVNTGSKEKKEEDIDHKLLNLV